MDKPQSISWSFRENKHLPPLQEISKSPTVLNEAFRVFLSTSTLKGNGSYLNKIS
jgi:hypothetical protein